MTLDSDTPLADIGIVEFSDRRADAILESLRALLAKTMGVTVQGPYVTVRFGRKFQVSMIVTSVLDDEIREEAEEDK